MLTRFLFSVHRCLNSCVSLTPCSSSCPVALAHRSLSAPQNSWAPACGPTSHTPKTLSPTSLEAPTLPRVSQSPVPPTPLLPFTAWLRWPPGPTPASPS